MANKHLRLAPHWSGKAWWYELPSGIEIHVDHRENGERIGHATIKIPWRTLRNAIKRKDKMSDDPT